MVDDELIILSLEIVFLYENLEIFFSTFLGDLSEADLKINFTFYDRIGTCSHRDSSLIQKIVCIF
jgi:hypothetical protein